MPNWIGPPPPLSERPLSTVVRGQTASPAQIVALLGEGAELVRIDQFPRAPRYELCYTSTAVVIDLVPAEVVEELVTEQRIRPSTNTARMRIPFYLSGKAPSE